MHSHKISLQEILTMKSGAVQNSPPDKSLPEPSPWSPVCHSSSITLVNDWSDFFAP